MATSAPTILDRPRSSGGVSAADLREGLIRTGSRADGRSWTDLGYPRIDSLPPGTDRPLWSVMIPIYNRTTYLAQSLRCVLEQDPGPSEMQIEVVDNASPDRRIEQLVAEIGKGRVDYFRQPENVGVAANWTTCVRRARGQLVHILHDDDILFPGFYQRLGEGLLREPEAGAAFCRHAGIDVDGHWMWLSELERSTAGVLTGWLELIATSQRIQCPSIAVRREVYERLGGFHPELAYALDWDMWKRIAVCYPIWYEPSFLAGYRCHQSSETSRLSRLAADTADTRKAIQLAAHYLPRPMAGSVTGRALEIEAQAGFDRARRLIDTGNPSAAAAQIREALRCRHSTRTLIHSARLLLWAGESAGWRTLKRGLRHFHCTVEQTR